MCSARFIRVFGNLGTDRNSTVPVHVQWLLLDGKTGKGGTSGVPAPVNGYLSMRFNSLSPFDVSTQASRCLWIRPASASFSAARRTFTPYGLPSPIVQPSAFANSFDDAPGCVSM